MPCSAVSRCSRTRSEPPRGPWPCEPAWRRPPHNGARRRAASRPARAAVGPDQEVRPPQQGRPVRAFTHQRPLIDDVGPVPDGLPRGPRRLGHRVRVRHDADLGDAPPVGPEPAEHLGLMGLPPLDQVLEPEDRTPAPAAADVARAAGPAGSDAGRPQSWRHRWPTAGAGPQQTSCSPPVAVAGSLRPVSFPTATRPAAPSLTRVTLGRRGEGSRTISIRCRPRFRRQRCLGGWSPC